MFSCKNIKYSVYKYIECLLTNNLCELITSNKRTLQIDKSRYTLLTYLFNDNDFYFNFYYLQWPIYRLITNDR